MAFKLRTLGFGTRVGLTALMVVLLGGMAASLQHLLWHYANRDERPEFTMDDIRANYRGLDAPAPLLTALQRGHPEKLSGEARGALVFWLKSGKQSENYDNLDLGAQAPSELIAKNCVECHSRKAAATVDAKAKALPLDYWDDVKKIAFSRKIDPTPPKIIAMSTHAHALSLGTMSLVLAAFGLATMMPRRLIGALVCFSGLGLAGDIGSWWLARNSDLFVPLIAASGGIYSFCTVLLILLVAIDLWLPRPKALDGASA